MEQRKDNRAETQLREVQIIPGVNPYAEGSAEIRFGDTSVLITASVEQEVPKWLEPGGRGWITAEYGMLPRSTHRRSSREAVLGKQSGRTMEIQRLIGRGVRAAVDLEQLSGLTIKLDCDVLVADGGTRTAAISGAWVALFLAVEWAKKRELIDPGTKLTKVAAVSVGVVRERFLVDLDYAEDSTSDFDLNLVFNEREELIEVQGTAEKRAVAPAKLSRLIDLGSSAALKIFEEQQRAISLYKGA